MEPTPKELRPSCRTCSHNRSKFCAFSRLGYSGFTMPRHALVPFQSCEAAMRNTFAGNTGFWRPPSLRFRFPVVAAASPDAASENPKPDPESRGFFTDFFKSRDDVDRSMFAPIPGETGRDRLRIMYSKDQFGNLGPEWIHTFQGLYMGAFAGLAIGFVVGGRTAAERFVKRNEGTKFLNEMAARRALQDKMTISMVNYSWRWGWRMAVFTSIYLFTATNMSVYRGKSGVLDYMVAGGVTGALWKFVQGPKAMLVAGTLGSILGLLAGAVSLAVLRAGGMSMEEMRYWHYQAQVKRQGEVIGKVLPQNLAAIPAESDTGSFVEACGESTGKT